MCRRIPSPKASTVSFPISYPRLRFRDPNAHKQLLTPCGMKSSAPRRSVMAASTQFSASLGRYSSPCWCMVAMAQTALDMFWHAYSSGRIRVSCFAMSGRILGAVGCSARSFSVTPQFARPQRVDDTSRGPNLPRPSSSFGGSSLSRCSTSSASMASSKCWNRGSLFTGTTAATLPPRSLAGPPPPPPRLNGLLSLPSLCTAVLKLTQLNVSTLRSAKSRMDCRSSKEASVELLDLDCWMRFMPSLLALGIRDGALRCSVPAWPPRPPRPPPPRPPLFPRQ
mmetsp:Transcript_3529/g.14120  ORF Transcript_3529/g.14120 Transcript_3529/m.14120 type:complete len:281 (-) Transcript_3529:431-1273(-)